MRSSLALFLLCVLVALSALGSACGGNHPPELEPLSDKVVVAGSELSFTLRASDADGDALEFSFTSATASIQNRASLSPTGASTAVFRWTPVATDVGTHAFDFSVSDGQEVAKQTMAIEVRAAGGTGPVFRKPLGTGTLLDLSKKPCIDLEIVVDDPDTANVTIAEEPPLVAGATFSQESGTSATWSWCPTEEQIDAEERYVLSLSADDHANPKATKAFLIVLRKPTKPGCPGTAPVIEHTPKNESTVVGLTIAAKVTDDIGIKHEPLLYWSSSQPADPPDLAQMTQVAMIRLGGDAKSGDYGADVPNPVAGKPAGTQATLYYVIAAQDDDDPAGSCDHLTQVPATGAFQMTVTNPGGQGGLGLCAKCTADSQCGGPADNCLKMGSQGESYCFKACTGDGDCGDAKYYCSLTEWTSVDGVKSRQCIPKSFSCVPEPPKKCVDDAHEPDDTLADAMKLPGLQVGTLAAQKSCPKDPPPGNDEDWYPIDILKDSAITLSLEGGPSTDLDMSLHDIQANIIVKSAKVGSSESIAKCLTPGTYFVRVYSWDDGENSYSLTYARKDETCPVVCQDDTREPDSNASQARNVTLDVDFPYKSNGDQICPNDEDWFKVLLIKDETIYVTVKFTQTNPKQDLDVRFYKGTTLLTKCTETDVSGCDEANGQSLDSNENFKWKVDATGDYFVVVHGWDGSSNKYDICIGLKETVCPKLP
jgi:hypothetical protein